MNRVQFLNETKSGVPLYLVPPLLGDERKVIRVISPVVGEAEGALGTSTTRSKRYDERVVVTDPPVADMGEAVGESG